MSARRKDKLFGALCLIDLASSPGSEKGRGNEAIIDCAINNNDNINLQSAE